MPDVTSVGTRVPKKVLLLSVGTGEGHNSAARAIAEVLRARKIACEIVDSVSFLSARAQKRAVRVYSRIIRHTPLLFGLGYAIGAAYDKLRLPSPIRWYHSRYADRLYRYIADGGFDCVICTHLFSMHTATAVRRAYLPDLPCYGVLTDYTAIPFYRGTDLDAYFVPDKRTRDMLTRKQIPSERILQSGIPVSPRFSSDMTRQQARALLGIDPDKKVVVIASGGAGCGKIRRLCKALAARTDERCAIYVFTGKNARLKSRVERAVGAHSSVTALAFTPDIPLYVKAADLAMTKPGGLSATEIAVSGTPMLLMRAIPGCETCNRRYFVRRNVAIYCNTHRKAVREALRFLRDGSMPFADAVACGAVCPDAASDIVDYVLGARRLPDAREAAQRQ